MTRAFMLALVLVLALSTVGLAERLPNEELPTALPGGTDKIEVNIDITKQAIVSPGESISFVLKTLGKNLSTKSTLIVETNTDVVITLYENISRVFLERIRDANGGSAPAELVWRWDLFAKNDSGVLDNDNWIVSPDVHVVGDWYAEGHKTFVDGMGWQEFRTLGHHELQVYLEATWRAENSKGEPLPWYLLEAGDDITGTIDVIVSAQI